MICLKIKGWCVTSTVPFCYYLCDIIVIWSLDAKYIRKTSFKVLNVIHLMISWYSHFWLCFKNLKFSIICLLKTWCNHIKYFHAESFMVRFWRTFPKLDTFKIFRLVDFLTQVLNPAPPEHLCYLRALCVSNTVIFWKRIGTWLDRYSISVPTRTTKETYSK